MTLAPSKMAIMEKFRDCIDLEGKQYFLQNLNLMIGPKNGRGSSWMHYLAMA